MNFPSGETSSPELVAAIMRVCPRRAMAPSGSEPPAGGPAHHAGAPARTRQTAMSRGLGMFASRGAVELACVLPSYAVPSPPDKVALRGRAHENGMKTGAVVSARVAG